MLWSKVYSLSKRFSVPVNGLSICILLKISSFKIDKNDVIQLLPGMLPY